MLTLKAVYDGRKITFLNKNKDLKPCKVIVTFLDEELTTEELQELSEKNGSLDFLKDEDEIYTDKDLKIKY